MIVVGIDPGSRHLGWGVLRALGNRLEHIAHGVIDASDDLPLSERLVILDDGLREVLAPWEAEHTYLNFADTRRKAASLYSSASYHRLRRIKAIVDPTDLIRSNHPVPPAS